MINFTEFTDQELIDFLNPILNKGPIPISAIQERDKRGLLKDELISNSRKIIHSAMLTSKSHNDVKYDEEELHQEGRQLMNKLCEGNHREQMSLDEFLCQYWDEFTEGERIRIQLILAKFDLV